MELYDPMSCYLMSISFHTADIFHRIVYITFLLSLRLAVGTRVETVMIYNPDNNYIDDIMYRADTIIE